MKRFIMFLALIFLPLAAHASGSASRLDLTGSWIGIISVLIFFAAYLMVMAEEFIHLRKS